MTSNGCACGDEEISAAWKGVEDKRRNDIARIAGALLIIFPTRSLKVMTISLQADGCMGGTVYYTSIHTDSCLDSRIDMSQ